MTRRRHRRPAATGRAYLLCLVIFSFVAFAVPAIATADTVYLKSGRVIHTAYTRVENGMLVFSQHGGTVSIPMSAVERIERNTNVEPAAAAPPQRVAAAGSETALAPKGPRRASAAYPWDDAEYWGERLIEIDRRIERVEGELDRLPAYRETDRRVIVSGQMMYFIAERAKWEGFHARLLNMRSELERSARKAGIAPGALRKARQRRR